MNEMGAAPVAVKKSRAVTKPAATAPGARSPPNELAGSPEWLAAENSLLNFVAQAVRDPAIDVAKLEALLRMQREIVAEDARVQFNRSFAALSAEIRQIERRGVADMGAKGAYKFAKREDLDAMLRPLMREHGFAVSFRPVPGPNGNLTIEGELMHVAVVEHAPTRRYFKGALLLASGQLHIFTVSGHLQPHQPHEDEQCPAGKDQGRK